MKIDYEIVEKTKKEISEIQFFENIYEIERDRDYKIISSFEDAYFFAFEKINYDFEKQSSTWIDIIEDNIAIIWEDVYKNQNYKEIAKEIDDIENINEDSIYIPLEDEDVYEEIINELALCVRSRAIMGTNNEFFEKMFKAYKYGGWPCGWEGDLKTGKMIVYYPDKKM